VCGGLGEAHRLGIVHRNLTPEGVVLGPGGLVKVTNFGMAKLASFGVVTTADQQIGSMLYAAPEQLVGKEEVGPRADVYGLGVLLYEAITGERPMGPGPYNAMTVVSWHLREQARPLRERVPWAPADLEALVHQMLEKAPSMRPVSVLEVHDRLRDARVSLRAPLLREVRNAAPVERPIALAPTQPMPASPDLTPPAEDRPAVLPARVPVPASPRVVAPHRVARPEEPLFRPEASGEVRVTGEPVESEARISRPASRSTMAALTLAAAAAVTAGTLWSHLTGPAQGAGRDPPAPAAPVSAPAPSASAPTPSASAATPRSRGAGAPPRPRAPAPRPKN
jgi:eukaryotic-like serine/threonine-protein kinase